MKVSIMRASGYIGFNVPLTLGRSGHEVRALIRSQQKTAKAIYVLARWDSAEAGLPRPSQFFSNLGMVRPYDSQVMNPIHASSWLSTAAQR